MECDACYEQFQEEWFERSSECMREVCENVHDQCESAIWEGLGVAAMADAAAVTALGPAAGPALLAGAAIVLAKFAYDMSMCMDQKEACEDSEAYCTDWELERLGECCLHCN